MQDTSSVKIPLKLRLKAWWEGYDTDELKERLADQMPDGGALGGAQKKNRMSMKEQARQEQLDLKNASEEGEELDPWDADKVNISQFIWGDGFCGPGGPDYIVTLSKLLALSPEMSMLQLGAGLGGPARVLADRFGVWITGYEESALLVERGNEMSKMQGMERKAALERYNPDTLEEFTRKFDRAMAKEALFTIKDKRHIINALEEKLKPGGLFLITDYVAGSEAAKSSENYVSWKVGERSTPYTVLVEDYEEMLKEANMQVRVNEDISDTYVNMINKAWSGADEIAAKLAKEENGSRMIQVLMREAEFWTRRKKLLESGDLKLQRIVANKKSNGPSMMSDW